MMFVKNSSLDKVDNDLLIIKFACPNGFHVTYNDYSTFIIDVDDLIVDDYENYPNNKGTNLDLKNLSSIFYNNKDNEMFNYTYGGC